MLDGSQKQNSDQFSAERRRHLKPPGRPAAYLYLCSPSTQHHSLICIPNRCNPSHVPPPTPTATTPTPSILIFTFF